ncbi:MAG: hypothetical protein H7175_23215 [Burkholderiales bacterium]|nr:hypothetical protein [Anaerolineae bacterium]
MGRLISRSLWGLVGGLSALLAMVGMSLALLAAPVSPSAAQDSAFATNTPRPSLAEFPPVTPDAPLERFALRLWTENDLINVLLRQIRQMQSGETEAQTAIRLTQHELEQRYPGAPHDLLAREALIATMLGAPRGSIDMREVVRPFIEARLSSQPINLQAASLFDVNGFRVEVTPANFDGLAPMDALLYIRYPANDEAPRYEDYVLARGTTAGLTFLNAVPALPAAPLGAVERIELQRLADFNGDGTAELAISAAERSALNQTLYVYGLRTDRVAQISQPDVALTFTEIRDWPADDEGNDELAVTTRRIESAFWGCQSELTVFWRWNTNYFRPTPDSAGFLPQNTLACRLASLEPLFAQPPADVTDLLESTLIVTMGETQTAQRGRMVLAMLYLLDGRTIEANALVQELRTEADANAWLTRQTSAFLSSALAEGSTAVQVCAALEAASITSTTGGACDLDAVLTRIFTEQPLLRADPIEDQLNELGIEVVDTQIITEIGRFPRTAVRLGLPGAERWWAFAPQVGNDETYSAEAIASPGIDEDNDTAALPNAIIPSERVYNALLGGNTATALDILLTQARTTPNAPLTPEALYVRALSYDLLGDRVNARTAFFSLWSSQPDNLWGQLAAAHLERR